jgi:hypothetical protein
MQNICLNLQLDFYLWKKVPISIQSPKLNRMIILFYKEVYTYLLENNGMLQVINKLKSILKILKVLSVVLILELIISFNKHILNLLYMIMNHIQLHSTQNHSIMWNLIHLLVTNFQVAYHTIVTIKMNNLILITQINMIKQLKVH